MTSARTSPLDTPLHITFFLDQFARTKTEQTTTLRDMVDPIKSTRAPSKPQLPWLKLARFGDTRTQRGSLRHDDNVLEVTGIEADYDGAQITLEQAEATLRAAGIAALIYTSPKHTPAAPRWRVLCPTSAPLPPAMRGGLVARLNGLFGGALAGESFTLSQAYYYGSVAGNLHHSVVVVDGEPLDLASHLDAGAIGRQAPARKEASKPLQVRPWSNKTAAPGKPWATATVTPPADASHYGRAALEGACDDLRHAHDGGKHHAVNKAGWSVGGLVSAGEVLDGDAWRALNDALAEILPRCEDQRAAQRTLANAYREGKGKPRDVPDPPPVMGGVHPAQGMLDIINRAAAAKPLAIGADIMDVDGALGQFVAYCNATAISPQPFLALAAGITAIGVLAGRKYRTRTNLRSNVYAVGIADSGGGKDHARKQIKAVFAAAGVTKYMGGEDLASGTGMMTALAGHPAKLFQIDEFGDWLGDVLGPKAAPHRKQIAQRLKTLYSDAGSFVCGSEYADQSKTGKPREDIQEPHACLYGTTTPAQFWRAIAAGSLEDGLLARFFIFVSPESYPDRQKPAFYDPPAALVEAFKAISRGAGTLPPGNLPEPMAAEMVPTATAKPYTVPMTAEAEAADEAMQDHQLARQRKHAGTHVTAIAGRLAENATKLALIRAVSRDPAAPVIEAGDIAWGRALAEHCIDTLLREADDNVAETPFARNVQAAKKLIRKIGPCTKRDMQRKGWRLPDREADDILKMLEETGEVIATAKEGGTGKGRPAIRYTPGAR